MNSKRGMLPEHETEPEYSPQAYLRPQEAADRLHLSADTLAKWRIKGMGPAFRKHGSKVIYGERDLDIWSDQQRRSSTSQTSQQAHAAFTEYSAIA